MPQRIKLFNEVDSISQLPVGLDLTQPRVWPVDSIWQVSDKSWQYFNLDSAIKHTDQSHNKNFHDSTAFQYVPSLFETSSFQAEWGEPQKVNHDNLYHTLLGVLLLFVLVLAVVLKLNAVFKIKQLIKSSFRINNFCRFIEDYQPGWMPPVFTSYLISILIFSGMIISWVFPLLPFTDGVKIGISLLLILAVILVPLIRSLLLVLWGKVFSTQQLAMFHVQYSYVSQLFAAIFLFPFFLNHALNLELDYWLNSTVMWVGLGCIWLYQLVRIWIQGNTSGVFSVFYLFVYLCTLEIIPLLLTFRLIGYIGNS